MAEISGETILKVLGGLPEEDRHCGLLAAEALQEALDGYMSGHSGLARYQEQGFEVITF